MIMKNKKSGLTLIEIIVATLIMAITMSGLVNLFVSSKRWLVHSRARMTGGELGRYFLDPSSSAIQQNDWSDDSNDYVASNSLHKRTDVVGPTVTLDREYSSHYTVSVIPGFNSSSQPRKVKVRINWDEPQ